MADETANPRYVAADLLSQAEHDELASAILVTTSEALAKEVSDWTDRFIRELSRGEIIRKSLDNYGHILLADTLEDAIDAANEIASEHMEIVTADPFEIMTKDPERRRHLYRRVLKRTAGRLFCRTEPRASDQRDGEILLASVR